MAADFYASHYRTGEEIRAGDRILWAGVPGTVVFVVGSPDAPPEWTYPQEWLEEPEEGGYMLNVVGTGLVFESESDSDLEFLSRRESP